MPDHTGLSTSPNLCLLANSIHCEDVGAAPCPIACQTKCLQHMSQSNACSTCPNQMPAAHVPLKCLQHTTNHMPKHMSRFVPHCKSECMPGYLSTHKCKHASEHRSQYTFDRMSKLRSCHMSKHMFAPMNVSNRRTAPARSIGQRLSVRQASERRNTHTTARSMQ